MLVPAALVLCALPLPQQPDAAPPVVHSVSDISQEFTFYMDGRFHTQYLQGVGRDVRNWGSLDKLELDNANLLLLTGGDPHIPYTRAAIDNVLRFVRGGGAVLLMVDGGEPMPPAAALVARLGGALTTTPARPPLARTTTAGDGAAADDAPVTYRGGTVLALDDRWQTVVADAVGRPVLAQRKLGRGHALLGSRGLFGHRPDASDPINAEWITPLLVAAAKHKPIDPDAPLRGPWAELDKAIGPLVLEFHAGTQPYADRIAQEYLQVRPHLVALTGVEPAPGMIKRLLILPTGGGGFSSGNRIAIGAFWGDYPEQRYPMVELIAHEAGHSWVLPHPEPLWNEPIATYLGIQVGKRLGMAEAQRTLDHQLERGRAHDPDYTQVDPMVEGAPRDLVWGKSYFVFEELERRHGPGALAKYFRAKRRLVQRSRERYTMDDCVAVWSRAVGEDLFGWFRSLAFDVDAARTELDDGD